MSITKLGATLTAIAGLAVATPAVASQDPAESPTPVPEATVTATPTPFNDVPGGVPTPTPTATPSPLEPKPAMPERKTIKVKRFRKAARYTYYHSVSSNGCFRARPEITEGKRKLVRFKSMAKNRKALKIMRAITKHQRKEWRLYRYADRITPYGCWAIPSYIVYCESKYDMDAYNRSGALGWYQLLGKGAPWPIRSVWAMIRHHEIAYYLYDGGNGASHWVCA